MCGAFAHTGLQWTQCPLSGRAGLGLLALRETQQSQPPVRGTGARQGVW